MGHVLHQGEAGARGTPRMIRWQVHTGKHWTPFRACFLLKMYVAQRDLGAGVCYQLCPLNESDS